MHRAPRTVAAALSASGAAALVVAALAWGGGARQAAQVTLQIAPRGAGTVTLQPPGRDSDNQLVGECKENSGEDSCSLRYERGTSVKLTASGSAGFGTTFSGWSTPDCPGTGSCTLTLEDDATSVVAVFDPLRLGVQLSNGAAGSVTTEPAGKSCPRKLEGQQCFAFPPHTTVKVTVKENSGHTFRGWNPGCEPTNAKTCTVAVEDEPTWVGARFDNDDPPQLPTTIKVQFLLKRSGSGGGRVTASKLDCGTVCTATYDYGKTLSLTATPDGGSTFEGWNGVCAKTQRSCAFPVGPITSIKAIFARDTAPPTVPGGLTVTSSTRTSIAISWTASTDNVSVTGYRVYLNDAAAGDTQATAYSLERLACGRTYAVGVDAVDENGNRSQRASLAAYTQLCPLAARVAGVGVQRIHGTRTIVVKLRVNRPTTARVTLLHGGRKAAGARYAVKPGTNALRLAVPGRRPGGPYRLAVALVNPDGGTLALPTRNVLIPRTR